MLSQFRGRGWGGRGGAQQVEEVQFSQQRVVEAQSAYDSLSYEAYERRRQRSPPGLPAPVHCYSAVCHHQIVFGVHYSRLEWEEYKREERIYRNVTHSFILDTTGYWMTFGK